MLDRIGENSGRYRSESQPLSSDDHKASSHLAQRSLRTGFLHRLRRNVQKHRGRLLMGCTGLLLVAIALTILLVDPVERIIAWQTSMEEGTVVYNFWRKPPVNVLLNVYVFNITNPAAFLDGREKLRLKEFGPFVYRELYENTNVRFNPNGTVSFTPMRNLRFERELSVADHKAAYFTLPNIPYLGAVSMLHSSSIFTNLGLRSLTTYLDSQPFVNLSVHDILLGYDDPLVRIAHTVLPSFVEFKRFGILDRMYAQPPGGEFATMKAGFNAGVDPNSRNKWLNDVFSLDTHNGSPGLPQWGYGKTMILDPKTNRSKPESKGCNMVRGALEGFMFPRNMNQETQFMVFRRAFCRTFPARFDHEAVSDRGYRTLWFRLNENAMVSSAEENSCYCELKSSDCPPNGTTDLSPCYHNIPLLLSKPHFFQGERKLWTNVEGLKPDPKYESYLVIQPELGVPLSIRCQVQLNLAMKKAKLHPKLIPFNDLILPILWIDFNVKDLSPNIQTLMHLALVVGPIAQLALITLLAVIGGILLLVATFRQSKNQHFYSSVVIDPTGKNGLVDDK